MATATAHPARFLHKHRIEALTDGIYAVAMTILVLELKFRPGATFATGADFHFGLLHLSRSSSRGSSASPSSRRSGSPTTAPSIS
jgi:hypothetical protein